MENQNIRKKWSDPETWKRVLDAMQKDPTMMLDSNTLAAIRKGPTAVPANDPKTRGLREFLKTAPEYKKTVYSIIEARDKRIAQLTNEHRKRISKIAVNFNARSKPPTSGMTATLRKRIQKRGPRTH